MGHGFEGFIDDTIPSPPRYLDPQQYNRMIMSWFYSSHNEDEMGEIVGFNTAFEIWESLCTVYESSSTTRIMGLRSQLQKIKKDGLFVSQYLAQIKDVSDNL